MLTNCLPLWASFEAVVAELIVGCSIYAYKRRSYGWKLSSEVPASVAAFGARIEQPAKAHMAFLCELVDRLLVQQPPDLLELFLLPCNSTCAMLSSILIQSHAPGFQTWDLQFWTHKQVLNLNWPCSGCKGCLCITWLLISNVLQFTILHSNTFPCFTDLPVSSSL